MEVVKSLLADDPAMLLRESMGIGADSTQKAFYSADIQGFLDRKPQAIPRHFYEDHLSENTRHVCVAVDPAGGGASAFAISSVVQLPSGGIIVRSRSPPCPSCPAARPPTCRPAPRTPARTPRGTGSCA